MNMREMVFEALDNASGNGFDPHRHTAEEIAEDLNTYDADLENIGADILIPFIREWLAK